MKKTLLSFTLFFSVVATAQTLTEANHAPYSGNSYGTHQCDSVAPGASGSGATWDFSSINVHTSIEKNYTSVVSANPAFPNAWLAVGSAANNTSYYSSSPSFLKYHGGDLSINTFELNIKYTSPAVYAAYPMSLNSTTTSITSGSVNITQPTTLSGTFNGTCNVIVDGAGTLMLPAKTFTNVIRVVTTQNIDANLGFITATVNLKNYEYYESAASKFPLFSINTSTISSAIGGTSTQTITTILKNNTVVGINEAKAEVTELSVFPNPATNLVNFTTTNAEAVKVTAIDVTGKIIATETIEMGKAKLNTSNFADGVYIYHITDKHNQTLKTGKFSVSK